MRNHSAGPFRLITAVALVCSALLAGCGAPPTPPQPSGVPVSVIPVSLQDVSLTTSLTGRIQPFRVAEIRPQVSGVIQERLFVEGSLVSEGQVLYRIDPALHQAALDNASAALARARASEGAISARQQRIEGLLPTKAVSQQDFDNVVAELDAVRAEIQSWEAQAELARINLGYTEVRSPIAGRIGRSAVTEGAAVTAYQPIPLATVQQLDRVYLDLPQATSDVQRLRTQLAAGRLVQEENAEGNVRITLEDGSEYPLAGTLRFRDVSVNPATASVILRAIVPNPQGVLLPGMFVHAELTEGVNTGAVLIPQPAVLRDPKGNPFCWVVAEDQTAAMRTLVLDRAIGDQWVVLDGLSGGESLIIEGLQRLRRPGTPVVVTPRDDGATANTPATGH